MGLKYNPIKSSNHRTSWLVVYLPLWFKYDMSQLVMMPGKIQKTIQAEKIKNVPVTTNQNPYKSCNQCREISGFQITLRPLGCHTGAGQAWGNAEEPLCLAQITWPRNIYILWHRIHVMTYTHMIHGTRKTMNHILNPVCIYIYICHIIWTFYISYYIYIYTYYTSIYLSLSTMYPVKAGGLSFPRGSPTALNRNGWSTPQLSIHSFRVIPTVCVNELCKCLIMSKHISG